MIDTSKLNQRTTLTRSISATDNFLYVPLGSGNYFKPTEGTTYYATIVNGNKREIVLVTNGIGARLEITRAQDDTDASSFPSGSCLLVEWNPAQLCEFVQTCLTSPVAVMKPGTYCLECNTCIDVDAFGRITKIDGATKC